MYRPDSPSSDSGFSPPPPRLRHYPRLQYPMQQHQDQPRALPHQHFRRQFSPNYRRDRPPERPPSRPNFVIQLRGNREILPEKVEIEKFIEKLSFKPEKRFLFNKSSIAGTLHYQQWNEALETMVEIWNMRLNSVHQFTPWLVENVKVESDEVELRDRLKAVFLEKAKGLIEGELVQKWQKNLNSILDEIKGIKDKLNKVQRILIATEMLKKKEGLEAESDLIAKRIEEFRSGIGCVIEHLEKGPRKVDEDSEEGQGFRVLKFGRAFNWESIHCLMMRECRRLDDGLPIYSYRREILKQIHSQQITVLIGETGSGKSTQLVQFLEDSGIAANESVICTQPRKLAATSLARRVREESFGCYQNSRISFYPSYSSVQQLDSKVIFMTDHCLLMHYMREKQLSGVSCIIVDEAHERSLNTDLLLAVIKNLLFERIDLRIIIMSATADANQLAGYFFDCGTFHVAGRSFPVDIKYVPSESEGTSSSSSLIAPYVSEVVRVVTEIHRKEKQGTILAFLTSQMEVEWACEKFEAACAIALPLHGKLSYEDQHRVFLNYPGKRKVIFSTNVAETSLTIPGVKYVVDSGMMKENFFEPGSGMNLLRVCRISQSSANQRAGRGGRTEPGSCYRLFSKNDFESLSPHQEPEIRRVHLGIAFLRILALGAKNVQDFDFVDAPCAKSIEMAIRNLIQLGAVVVRDNGYELTAEGRDLVKLGIEPRLGKMILQCFGHRLGREGLVLAAVMANSSSIFCRIGSEQEKLKSDRFKVQFCHRNGDLFTLLAVYKAWEAVPRERRNMWCWGNSVNAKSMRRCHKTVQELELCLQHELNIIIPSYWRWDPQLHTEHDEILKSVILSSLAENVAMYSGYDQLGYEVALTKKHIQLHPSCSLLIFSERPPWVVFGDVLSLSNNYLVCVTAIDYKHLSSLCAPLPFDCSKMDSHKLHRRTLTGFGTTLLKRFCGKYNSGLRNLVSYIRTECMDERIGIQVNVDENIVVLYASLKDMEKVCSMVNDALVFERQLLHNECLEKCLYGAAATVTPSTALFGAGAEIKHLELERRYLGVDIYHSDVTSLDDKKLLMFVERHTGGSICGVHRFTSQENEEIKNWGRVTFLSPNDATNAIELNGVEFGGGLLKILPSHNVYGCDQKLFSFPAVRAKVSWPRKSRRGIAVKCAPTDVASMLDDFSSVMIGDKFLRCKASNKYADRININLHDIELSEVEILGVLTMSTNRLILDSFLLREQIAVQDPPSVMCEEALLRELSPFMPKRNRHSNCVRVQVFPPEPKDTYTWATITFDASLHLEAAKALQQIDGKRFPGGFPWQKIRCQQLFHSTVSCPGPAYHVIKDQLDSLLARLRQRNGVECHLERNENGSYRVKISGNATKTVAELRRPFEELMRGKVINHDGMTPAHFQYLFSRDGVMLMKSVQIETGTFILFDRHRLVVRVFGSPVKIDVAEQKFVKSILAMHESRQLEVHLRGGDLPSDLMKKVVQKFGPDLHGLEEMVPAARFFLNTKRHCISINGTNAMKQQVEDIIHKIAETCGSPMQDSNDDISCPICLCEVEDSYMLESCRHKFCRLCLVEQCDSAIRTRDGFPLLCTQKGCGAPILVTDLKYLLSSEKLEDLFRASLAAYVAGSGGSYRFCPSPDCPSVYQVADSGTAGAPFVCGACYVETCTRCHLEYHPDQSCEMYKALKDNPDLSLDLWCKGKENVKKCPSCRSTVEKVEGCNHIECKCGLHVCWVCLEFFSSSDDCYNHLRSVHNRIG